jgi:CYTH domain
MATITRLGYNTFNLLYDSFHSSYHNISHIFRLNRKEMNNIKRSDQLETEASLIIRSENPKEQAEKITKMNFLEYYKLLSTDTQDIHDIYFDTHDESLQNKKISLRIRSNDQKNWITLKGSSERTGDDVAANRLEIEEAWSEDSLRKAFAKLSESGTEMPPISQKLEGEPIHVLKNIIRIKVIQERITKRKIRSILLDDEKNGPILGEMDIDYVEYNFEGITCKPCYYNIEIEERVKCGSIVMKSDKSIEPFLPKASSMIT